MKMSYFALIALVALFVGCIGGWQAETNGAPTGGDGAPEGGGAAGGNAAADDADGLLPNDDGGTEDSPFANGTASISNGSAAESNGTAPSAGEIGEVLLLGRSVGYGWASYMGLEYDDETGTHNGTYGGKRIRYREVLGPPDIADSAIGALDEYDSEIVFFKLCFVDFSSEAGDGLSDNKGYVQKVYNEAVVKRGRKLIVGNALPQTAQSTTSGMRYNHEKYNEWLAQFASTHDDIYVLDLYGMLSDSDGDLRADYAASWDDSHLNDKAYARITPDFMGKISEAESG